MKNLKAKLRKKGGFTLIEMLIVVAIIAILIAVSIPMVGSALESARNATDAANERSFKAALVSGHLLSTADMAADNALKIEADVIYAYDASNGVAAAKDATITAYGQSSANAAKGIAALKGLRLFGTITAKGEVCMMWAESAPPSIAAGANNCINGIVSKTTK